MLTTFAYLSRSLIGADAAEIAEIKRVSILNNRRCDITGALYFDERVFFQFLEGPPDAIEELFAALLKDPRHTDITILYGAEMPDRMFAGWEMKFIDGRTDEALGEPLCFDSVWIRDFRAVSTLIDELRAA